MELSIRETGISLVKKIMSDKSSLAQTEMRLEVKDVLNKPTVRSVFKNESDVAFMFTTAMIKRFMDSFGFSTKMTETQIEMLTVDALEHFSYETVEDMILFFKMARSGKFGTTNRGVDSNLIFGTWFPMYLEIKSDARELEYTKTKHDTNMDKRGATTEQVMLSYEKHSKTALNREAEIYIDKMIKDFDREMLEKEIEEWSKDDYKKQFLGVLKSKRRKFNR